MRITPDLAKQFALMINAGLPAEEAILYFAQDVTDPAQLSYMLQDWLKSREFRRAQLEQMGKSWTDMSLDERIRYALDQHYSGLAHFLFSHNYSSLGATDKAKADTARQALEAKLAGTAGKGDAMSQFLDDLRSGKLKLNKPAPPTTLPS